MSSIPRRRVHLADDSENFLNQITSTPATRETRFSRSQVRPSMDTPISERTFHPSLLGSRQPSVGGSLLVSYDGFLFLDGQGHYTAPDSQEHAKVIYAELSKCLDVLRHYAGLPATTTLVHRAGVDPGELSEEVDLNDEEETAMFEADKSKSGEEEEWSSRLGKKKARVEVSNVESLGKMTVTQLRQQLQAAGLSGKGTKAMLQDRLAKFVEERDHRQQKHSNGNDRNRHEEDSEVILIPQRWSRNSGPLMRSPPSVTSSSMQSGPCFLGSLNVTATTAPFEGSVQRSDGVERASNLSSSGQRGSARIGVVPQREHEEAFETSLTQEDERALVDPEVRGTSLGTWWRHPGDHPTASYLQQSPQPRYSNPQPYHSSAMYNASRLSSRSSMENLYPLEMENSNHNNHNNHPWNLQEQELVGASDGLDGAYVEDGHTPRASAVSRASTAVLSNRSSQHLDSHEMIPMRDSRELDDVGDIPDHQNAGVGEKPVEGERQAEEDEENGRTSSFTQRRSSGAQTDLFFRRSGTPDGTQETVRSSQFDSPPSRSQNSSSGGGLWGTLLNAGTRLFKSVAPGTPANSERKRKRDSH